MSLYLKEEKKEFLEFASQLNLGKNESCQDKPYFFPRIALGTDLKYASKLVYSAINRSIHQFDCSERRVLDLLRAYLLYRNKVWPDEKIWDDIVDCALSFQYEHMGDNTRMCFNTENHNISFWALEYLVAQTFPDAIFKYDGNDSTYHIKRTRALILEWIDRHGRYGLTEWNSNHYITVNFIALINLYDFAKDPVVKEASRMMIDKLLTTMVLVSFNGVFGSSHGRTYPYCTKGGRKEDTSNLFRLLWGVGVYNRFCRVAMHFATSPDYKPPEALSHMIKPPDRSFEVKQRDLNNYIYTYKASSYMLSNIQDLYWRTYSGQIHRQSGGQQHIWQATFDMDSVVFLNNPGYWDNKRRPSFWIGNATLPRTVQVKNVLLCLYNLGNVRMPYTHAYFPVETFDEYCEKNRWIFGRKGSGYIGLYACNGLYWNEVLLYDSDIHDAPDKPEKELKSDGTKNAWICHLGKEDENGSFTDFIDIILNNQIEYSMEEPFVRYNSHDNGVLEMGWSISPKVNGETLITSNYEHIESPFVNSKYGSGTTAIEVQNRNTIIDIAALQENK